MTESWHLSLSESHGIDVTGVVELGRQSAIDEPLFQPHGVAAAVVSGRQLPDRVRVAVAHRDENSVSRHHALVEPLTGGGFRLTNLSNSQRIQVSGGRAIDPQTSCELRPGALLQIGTRMVRLQQAVIPSPVDDGSLQSLSDVTLPPGQSVARGSFTDLPLAAAGVEARAVLRWLQASIDVLQITANADELYAIAARALVDLVNLDSGQVVLYRDGRWEEPSRIAVGQGAGKPSTFVLDGVLKHRRTFWKNPPPTAGPSTSGTGGSPSYLGLDAVVAAPLLDRNGQVIGALYGDRQPASALAGPITDLHALLVELLARGVAAGLARIEQERIVGSLRVMLEGFFTPELADFLARNPERIQKGQEREVTVLFCDIRGFSRISERLGPERTVEWIRSVMTDLSRCVRDHQGVLVDYIGDELMAMWGAPEDQPDHPLLACRAALDMMAALPRLNERWQDEVGETTSLGIGINTGVARVGNTGSDFKFKYGPLGNTVNLASRVQGATKYLQTRLLITGETRKHLDGSFAPRRLCQVRVVNIDRPVELYDLAPVAQTGWKEACDEYEAALAAFEKEEFGQAARLLGNLRGNYPDDGPALILLSRAVQHMVESPDPFDPVWVLPGK
jgi:adenylate cyclase